MNASLKISAILAICLALAGGAYMIFTSQTHVSANATQSGGTNTPIQSTTPNIHVAPPRIAPPGMQEFRDTNRRFSLFYPEEYTVKTYDEGEGAVTITFQNVKESKGFQIFIVPYLNAQISDDRFRHDDPSGVKDQPKEVKIDGARAVTFYSKDALLGDTAEIWMINNGYLYEITSLKSLAPWLSEMMKSWQFI